MLDGIQVLPMASLREMVSHLGREIVVAAAEPTALRESRPPDDVLNLAEVRGREDANYALEIAAAGGQTSWRLEPAPATATASC